MENQDAEGLEIVAIGSLYHGPWTKKYWSCSRGKDRYPYPVGYEAVRTCAGEMYTMGIHEGPKGPLFFVKTGCNSVTGQTPNIAWEKFKKKDNCQVKIWHGKRFSCKIDGVELFGFRNPLVQRLLRELVANEHGLTESSLVLSSCCKDSSTLQNEKPKSDLHRCPDILLDLEKQEIRSKKSMKQRTRVVRFGCKRLKTQDPLTELQQGSKYEGQTGCCGGITDDLHEISNKVGPSYDDYICQPKTGAVDWNNKFSVPNLLEKGTGEISILPRNKKTCSLSIGCAELSLLPTLRFEKKGDTSSALVKDNFTTVESQHSLYDCLREEDLTKDNGHLFGSEKLHGREYSVNPEESGRVEHVSTELNHLTSNVFLVPDSFELVHEGRNANDELNFKLENGDAPPAIVEDVPNPAIPVSNVPLSEELVFKSQSDEENHVGLGTQCSSSERSDSDTMNKELVKSMLEVFLPQALPLLKYSRKKKSDQKKKLDNVRKGDPRDISAINVLVKDHGSFDNNDILCSADGIGTESSVREPEAALEDQLQKLLFVEVDPIIADSLEDEKCFDFTIGHTPSIVGLGKADINPVGNGEYEKENTNLTDRDTKTRQTGEDLPFSNAVKSEKCHGFVPHGFESSGLNFFSSRHREVCVSEGKNSEINIENHLEVKGPPAISESEESLPFRVPKFSTKCHSSVACDLKKENKSGSQSNEVDDHLLRTNSPKLCPASEKVETSHIGLGHDRKVGPESNISKAKFTSLHFSFIQEDSDIYRRHFSPVKHTLDLMNLKCSDCPPETDIKVLVSETNDASLQHLQIAASGGEHIFASHNVNDLPCAPFASDYMKSDPSKLITEECTNTSVERLLYNKTLFGPQTSLNVVVEGNLSADLSCPNRNTLNKRCSDMEAERAISGSGNMFMEISAMNEEDMIMEVSAMDKDAVDSDTVKKGAVLACSSIPSIQDENEHKLSALDEQDVLNVSKKHDFLSLPAEDSCPVLWFKDPVNTISIDGQTDSMGILFNELVHGRRDDVMLNELRSNTFAHDHHSVMSTKSTDSSMCCTELISCFLNSMPVSSMLLRKQKSGILLCVICGIPEQVSRTLFIYEIPDNELTEKCPSFHGYAPVCLSLCSYNSDINFPCERSKIQFIPDGKFLVLLDGIKTPWCSKQDIRCSCTVCEAASEENSVKVVSVRTGYVSVVAKMRTIETSYCLLVCEPCYLVAAQKGGKLNVWVMNATWSMDVDEFTLPYSNDTASFIVELEKVPNLAYLIVGHDGVGGFGLWDVSRRVLQAKFSYSGCSIYQFLPFGFFPCRKNDTIPSREEDRDLADILRVSELSFLGAAGRFAYSLMDGEDVGVWLLVSAVSYGSNHNVEASIKNYTGCWRLALLVKDMLVLGSTLDARSSAANVLSGYGIIGRLDGLVYIWELSSGHKVLTLDHLKGDRIPCIASDASSHTFAVASDDCRVLLYMYSSSPRGS